MIKDGTIPKAILALGFVLAAHAAAAQTWQSRTTDTGALIYGAAFTADGAVTLSCTAPSPQGRPLMETGDHESLRTDTPYDLAISFSTDFLSPFGVSPDLPRPSLATDGARHALPAMQYSDFYGAWTGLTRFYGPGVLELFDATSITIDSGTGAARRYAADGLARALSEGLTPCIYRWLEMGHPLPPRLAAHMNRNQTAAQPVAPAAPATAPPAGLPPVMQQYLSQGCNGSYQFDTSQMGVADFDRDGRGDYVIDWGDITCQGGFGPRPNCGAANCLIDLFLSTRGYGRPEGILAIGFQIVALPNGQPGLMTSGTAGACQTGACDIPWRFDGRSLTK
ncbi:hypothetical protein AIOL_002873 [Candidatus Rhodobacter oscarellae]|uniref:Uncharacterized protein n=1 Tax=Candidatus Rhodobacter oscarellae TaxID=1675527 RepID=A0A0J9E528_9RHOB|nr:hypothetical protein [Candidatus Rhodobacter lobularis]KMW57905.1 hypothetical protein AIOL_002873 [Candidatus Rhodobacter lobularis]